MRVYSGGQLSAVGQVSAVLEDDGESPVALRLDLLAYFLSHHRAHGGRRFYY